MTEQMFSHGGFTRVWCQRLASGCNHCYVGCSGNYALQRDRLDVAISQSSNREHVSYSYQTQTGQVITTHHNEASQYQVQHSGSHESLYSAVMAWRIFLTSSHAPATLVLLVWGAGIKYTRPYLLRDLCYPLTCGVFLSHTYIIAKVKRPLPCSLYTCANCMPDMDVNVQSCCSIIMREVLRSECSCLVCVKCLGSNLS